MRLTRQPSAHALRRSISRVIATALVAATAACGSGSGSVVGDWVVSSTMTTQRYGSGEGGERAGCDLQTACRAGIVRIERDGAGYRATTDGTTWGRFVIDTAGVFQRPDGAEKGYETDVKEGRAFLRWALSFGEVYDEKYDELQPIGMGWRLGRLTDRKAADAVLALQGATLPKVAATMRMRSEVGAISDSLDGAARMMTLTDGSARTPGGAQLTVRATGSDTLSTMAVALEDSVSGASCRWDGTLRSTYYADDDDVVRTSVEATWSEVTCAPDGAEALVAALAPLQVAAGAHSAEHATAWMKAHPEPPARAAEPSSSPSAPEDHVPTTYEKKTCARKATQGFTDDPEFLKDLASDPQVEGWRGAYIRCLRELP